MHSLLQSLHSLPLHLTWRLPHQHTICLSVSSDCTYSYTFTALNNCCCCSAPRPLLFSVLTSAVILAAAAHKMSVLSLAPSLVDYISSSSCLQWMCSHCLLSSWSDSLLARCLEQLSNLINSRMRPLLLPGCFTWLWALEAECIQGLWPNGDRLVSASFSLCVNRLLYIYQRVSCSVHVCLRVWLRASAVCGQVQVCRLSQECSIEVLFSASLWLSRKLHMWVGVAGLGWTAQPSSPPDHSK